MAVNTVLFDFTVDISAIKNEQQTSMISTNIEMVLKDYFKNLKLLTTLPLENRDLIKIYNVDGNIIITYRLYHTNGLITLNIEYVKNENFNMLNFENSRKLERYILDRIDKIVVKSQTIIPIKRGNYVLYLTTSDDRLLEYDIDEVIFEEHTPYQYVQILHSISCGNMLVLDGYQNLAESDLIYTETLMNRGNEDYVNKEILILGGGDGALLYELLKEKPKEVIMLEIDEVVMKACAKYMRSVCGDVLDKMSGPNYKIIVGDCMKSIDQYLKEGRKFDYIFSDLTDIPLESGVVQIGELWDFVTKILKVSFRLLKSDGKFMTHVIGSVAKQALKMYEQQLNKLEPPVKYTTSKAWVPSFLEEWMFYQVYFDNKKQ